MVDTRQPSTEPTRRRDTEANARLTSWAGLILFVALAVQGITILRVGRLLTWHFVLGFALLGPLALKLGSTGYRFLRYYTGDQAYSEAGPPRPLLRVAAPILVLSTIGVFGTGVALAFVGHQGDGGLLLAHKVTFVVWFAMTTVHVLAYLVRAGRHVGADLVHRTPRRNTRAALVVASLVVGVAFGAAGLRLVHDWDHSRHHDPKESPLTSPLSIP